MKVPFPMTELTWSAVVPSYRRPRILERCLVELIHQDPKPKQVIVVGADSDPETEEQTLRQEILSKSSGIEFIFKRTKASISKQRNVGLDSLAADVCLFVDDDFFVSPGFMKRHLEIYAADVESKIVAIQGRPVEGAAAQRWYQSRFAEAPTAADHKTPASKLSQLGAQSRSTTRRLIWEVLYKYIGPMFPRYVHEHMAQIPKGLAQRFSLEPAFWLRGCCFSIRSRTAALERFSNAFEEYAAGEDVDFTYRLSRHGAICREAEAYGYHVQSNEGRPDTEKLIFTSLLNIAYIARSAMPQSQQLSSHIERHHRRFANSWALMGVLAGRGLNDYRAGLQGLAASKVLFDESDEDIDVAYRQQIEAWKQSREV